MQSRRPFRAFGFFVAESPCIMGMRPPPLTPPARGGERLAMANVFLPLDGGGDPPEAGKGGGEALHLE